MNRLVCSFASGWVLLGFLTLPYASGAVDYAAELVVREGDPAPGTGGGTFSVIGNPVINASGDAVFRGNVTGGTAAHGLFLISGGVVSPLVLEGDAAPAAIGGTFFAIGGSVNRILADSGDVVFTAIVTAGSTSEGVFRISGGSITPVVVQGDAAPAPAAGTFSSIFDAGVNAAGDLAFWANALDGFTTYRGIFRESGGTVSTVALVGDPAPGTGGGTYDSINLFRVGGGGDVLMGMSILTEPGLFVDSGGVDRAAVLSGDAAPAAVGGTYDHVSTTGPSIDGSDHTVFRASIAGGSAPAGIFLENGSSEEVVVLHGDGAPSSVGGTYSNPNLGNSPASNEAGDIVFTSSVIGGVSSGGLFLRGDGGIEVVELRDHKAPGTGGLSYEGFPNFTVGGSGHVLIDGAFDGGMRGLFLATPFELGSLAGLAGERIYREDFEGETLFPTSPDVDVRGFGALGPLVVGNGPPPAPVLGMGLGEFHVTDTPGALPVELAAIGLASADIQPESDAGISALFNELEIAGGGVVGVGVSLTTAGGSTFRADFIEGGASQLRLAETDPGGTVLDSETTLLPSPPAGPFVIELLVDRSPGTARALLRTTDGDTLTPELALSAAASETITTFGPLAFVLNGSSDSIDVDVLALEVYSAVAVPTLPAWGGGLLALALAGLALRRLARIPRRP